MSVLQIALRVAAVCLLSGLAALEAEEPNVLFEDDFTVLDSNFFSTPNFRVSVADNTLILDGNANWWTKKFYQPVYANDVDLTVQVRMPDLAAEKGAYLGLAFWIHDYNDYSYVAISDAGTVGAFTTTGSRTLAPFNWRKSQALNAGAEDWNELRVVTVGNRAEFFLNGRSLAHFQGKPPQGGGQIGFVFHTGSAPTSVRLRNLRLAAPSGDRTLTTEPTTDPDVILADDFSVFDLGWGSVSGRVFVKEGALVIKSAAEKTNSRLYAARAVDAMDATVKMKLVDDSPDSTTHGGLVFWSTPKEYAVFLVGENGQMAVVRWKEDRWDFPLDWRPIPDAAHFQAKDANELRVVATGRKAALYLNGVSVGEIETTPLTGDWQFGVFSMSGSSPGRAEFSSMSIRRPTVAP